MTTNTSVFTIPLAWFLAVAPRGYSVMTFQKHSKNEPELMNPRSFSAKVANDKSLKPEVRDRIIRAESAMFNGLENLGFYSAAVVAGNAAGVDRSILNNLTWGYLASRLLYNFVFINNHRISPFFRTGIFMVGTMINLTLYVLAGLKWQQ